MNTIIKKNRSKHYQFREIYKERQMSILSKIGIIICIYSIIAFFFLSNIITHNVHTGHIHFGFLFLVSVFSIIAPSSFVFIENKFKGSYCDLVSFLSMLGYSVWGLFSTYHSITEGRETNVLTSLIIYSFCVCLLNYSISAYTFFTIFLVSVTVLLLSKYNIHSSTAMVTNYFLLAFCLYIVGILRYNYERAFSLSDKELKNANEDLYAINEELTTTNDNLQDANEELLKLNEAQKLFTASMSHELRNPLNGVMGGLKMLTYEDNMSETQMTCVKQCFQASQSLLYIVNDLLDYSKIESGEFEIKKDDFDLREIIDNSINLLSMMALEKGVNIKLNVEDMLICGLYGDGGRIMQIFNNLISNAIKYNKNGGEVEVFVDVNDDILTIRVADNGEGIEQDSMDMLFTPYHRVQEIKHKKIQGTGLGLYIVKTIAELMGGNVIVDSEYGKGSIFTVKVHIKVSNPDLIYKRRTIDTENEPVIKDDYSYLNILVVDDTPINTVVAEGLLNKAFGIHVTSALSGMDCVNKLARNHYDLILLDHMMPVMDGVQTLKHIRNMRIEVPVIALTANAGPEYEGLYLGYGFDGYITKPLTIEAFREVLKKHGFKKGY